MIREDETFPRFSLHFRLQHVVLIVSFVLLVLTGLPVFLHDVPWMRSLVGFEGGFRLRSELHRVAAFGLVGLSAWHLIGIALHPRGRTWLAAMMIRPRDVGEFFGDLMFSLGVGDWLARRRPLRAYA